MELFSCKKNEIMTFASKWKEVKNIILSDEIQTQKDKHCKYSYLWLLAMNLTWKNHRNQERGSLWVLVVWAQL